eukprot:UN0419
MRSPYDSSRSIAPLGELSHVCRALPGTVVVTGGSALALAPRCKVQTLDASDMMSRGLPLCVLPVQRLSAVFAPPAQWSVGSSSLCLRAAAPRVVRQSKIGRNVFCMEEIIDARRAFERTVTSVLCQLRDGPMVSVPTGVFTGGVPSSVDGGHRVVPGRAPYQHLCLELKEDVAGCRWRPTRADGPIHEFACAWISDRMDSLHDEVPGAEAPFQGAEADLLAASSDRLWDISYHIHSTVG